MIQFDDDFALDVDRVMAMLEDSMGKTRIYMAESTTTFTISKPVSEILRIIHAEPEPKAENGQPWSPFAPHQPEHE